MSRLSQSALFVVLIIACQLAGACHNLPVAQVIGPRAYMLQQRMECKGTKVYDIDNVQDIEQCKEACRQFDCDAVNLFQISEFGFKCEILNYVATMVPAQGAACYYATDSGAQAGYGNGYNNGFGYFGRRK